MNMPDRDGFEVNEKIKSRPELATATILMLTSSDRAGDAARCRRLGVTNYLVKPILQRELRAVIAAALETGTGRAHPPVPDEETVTPKPLKLLLAEDNPVNQRVAVAMLKREGHTVTVVDNGADAVAAAAGTSFDAILMDVQMPRMGGFEATAAIREHERTTSVHVPIIALTASAMEGDRDRCLRAGMDDYISKPISRADLNRALRPYMPHNAVSVRTASPEEPDLATVGLLREDARLRESSLIGV
jgi:CheY-like chemotaxis protein